MDTLKQVKKMINDMEAIIEIQKERIEMLKKQTITSVRIGDVLDEMAEKPKGLSFYFQHNLQLDKIEKLKNMEPFKGKMPTEYILTEEEIDQINSKGYKLYLHIDGMIGAKMQYCSLSNGTLNLYDLDSEGVPLLYHSKIVWNDIFECPYLQIEENENILCHISVEDALSSQIDENMEEDNNENLQSLFIKIALKCNDYSKKGKESPKTKKIN